MNQLARPTGVSVISWVWIVLGGFMGFSAIMALLASSFMPQVPSSAEFDSQMPASFGLMMSVFRYFDLIALLQLAVAVLAVVAGTQLLKLRSWARTTLEALSWLSLLYVISFGVFWSLMWLTMTGQLPPGDAPFDPRLFQVFGLVMGAFITLVFAVPLVIMIRYLRGTVVRDAVQRARG